MEEIATAFKDTLDGIWCQTIVEELWTYKDSFSDQDDLFEAVDQIVKNVWKKEDVYSEMAACREKLEEKLAKRVKTTAAQQLVVEESAK